MIRQEQIAAFLEQAGWSDARHAPLPGDASARRYVRLQTSGRSALLMDMPMDSGLDPVPFIEVTNWLRENGYSAPEILASDPGRGLLLLEDLGNGLFLDLCDRDPSREAHLYASAIDLIADLQQIDPPGSHGGWAPPPYDFATLVREARLMAEWYLPAVAGSPASADLAAEYEALISATFSDLMPLRPVAVLRDYHAENLIWLPERSGHASVGLIDYQDMLTGHPAYDLVSLLEDARRDVSPALRNAMLSHYLQRTGTGRDEFLQAASTLSAQRNLKILGLFTRLSLRDGKTRYLALLPRVWGHLQRNLRHPALSDLSAWVAAHVPAPDDRLQPALAEPLT